jgi:hypothetical protein
MYHDAASAARCEGIGRRARHIAAALLAGVCVLLVIAPAAGCGMGGGGADDSGAAAGGSDGSVAPIALPGGVTVTADNEDRFRVKNDGDAPRLVSVVRAPRGRGDGGAAAALTMPGQTLTLGTFPGTGEIEAESFAPTPVPAAIRGVWLALDGSVYAVVTEKAVVFGAPGNAVADALAEPWAKTNLAEGDDAAAVARRSLFLPSSSEISRDRRYMSVKALRTDARLALVAQLLGGDRMRVRAQVSALDGGPAGRRADDVEVMLRTGSDTASIVAQAREIAGDSGAVAAAPRGDGAGGDTTDDGAIPGPDAPPDRSYEWIPDSARDVLALPDAARARMIARLIRAEAVMRKAERADLADQVGSLLGTSYAYVVIDRMRSAETEEAVRAERIALRDELAGAGYTAFAEAEPQVTLIEAAQILRLAALRSERLSPQIRADAAAVPRFAAPDPAPTGPLPIVTLPALESVVGPIAAAMSRFGVRGIEPVVTTAADAEATLTVLAGNGAAAAVVFGRADESALQQFLADSRPIALTVAHRAVRIGASGDSTLASLTLAQLAEALTGPPPTWERMGVFDDELGAKPVRVIVPAADRAAVAAGVAAWLPDGAAMREPDLTPATLSEIPGDAIVLTTGLLPAGARVVAIRSHGGQALQPTAAACSAGAYPAEPVTVYLTAGPTPQAKALASYLLASNGQSLLASFGLVPVSPAMHSEQSALLAAAAAAPDSDGGGAEEEAGGADEDAAGEGE